MSYRLPHLRSATFAVIALVLAGCAATPHGKTGVCQECYDAVNAARAAHPSAGSTHNEVISTYECPCCKTEMSVYIANGVHMVKCGGCAKEGVAWDKCTSSVHGPK